MFQYLPIESEIKDYQSEYYKVINYCNKNAESTKFIEFMLHMINEILKKTINSNLTLNTETSININKLLNVMKQNIPMTATEIMKRLGIKSKETLRSTYLDPAIKEGGSFINYS